MGFSALDDEEDKAKKYLGEGATFPPQKVDIAKLGEAKTAYDAFRKARDEMGPLLAECEKANEGIIFGLKQLADGYETADFGLDRRKKEDAKKLKQAHKQFADFFKEEISNLEDVNKGMDEVEKHLIQMRNYKPPPPRK